MLTFAWVGIYLLEPVFFHGHLYVALSESTARKNVKILVNCHPKILVIPDAHDKKKN
jgi:ATP-dependent DNA helicase PIF1